MKPIYSPFPANGRAVYGIRNHNMLVRIMKGTHWDGAREHLVGRENGKIKYTILSKT